MAKPLRTIPEKLLTNARRLRREMTPQETILWKHLRGKRFEGFKFRRQHPIGNYILDFFCAEEKIAIELDGGQHNFDTQENRDRTRDEFLGTQGIRVLRFWNNEVSNNFSLVLEEIYRALKNREV